MSFKKKNNTAVKNSTFDNVILTINFILLTIFFVIIAYPLLFVIFASVSGGVSTLSLNIIPERWSFVGYEMVFEYGNFWSGYMNSMIYVVSATVVSLIATICCAYPLSRSDFKFGGFVMIMCMITMYFGGGLIPSYLNIRNLGMLDSRWVMIIPGALSVYNMIVMRTYFKSSIPNELREAAYLDGCGDMRYLISIVLPLSGAIIAVISLYVAVGTWNNYFTPMIYLTDRAKLPLPIFLREILVVSQVDMSAQGAAGSMLDPEMQADLARRQRVMKYAVIVVASVPVMIIYPFVQKYFVKGVMIGSVKG